MHFEWTEEQQLFRDKLQHFMRQNLPDDWETLAVHGPASDEITEHSAKFCGQMANEGLLFPHWPVEAGGMGLDPMVADPGGHRRPAAPGATPAAPDERPGTCHQSRPPGHRSRRGAPEAGP